MNTTVCYRQPLFLLSFGSFDSGFHGSFACRANALHRVHDVGLRRQKGRCPVCRPWTSSARTLHESWKHGHRLDTRVQGLLGCGHRQGPCLQILIFDEPLLKSADFQRIRRSRQT